MQSLTQSQFSTEIFNDASFYRFPKEECFFPKSSTEFTIDESSVNYRAGVNTLRYSDYSSKFWFSGDPLNFKKYYLFQSDENALISFILKYKLNDFLSWVIKPISEIFGDIQKDLFLTKNWDEENYHLVLAIFSGIEDMDELTKRDDTLFNRLETYSEIDHIFKHVVIAQR